MVMLEERIKRASKTRQVVNHIAPPIAAEPPPPEPRQQGGNRNTSRPGTGIRPLSAASAGAARDNESEVKMRYQQQGPAVQEELLTLRGLSVVLSPWIWTR